MNTGAKRVANATIKFYQNVAAFECNRISNSSKSRRSLASQKLSLTEIYILLLIRNRKLKGRERSKPRLGENVRKSNSIIYIHI